MAASEPSRQRPCLPTDSRQSSRRCAGRADLLSCIHCGLCLNACPTYRELGIEMDCPRGRIYQMVQVATGQIEIRLPTSSTSTSAWPAAAANRPARPGVPYGRLIEAARTEIEAQTRARGSATARLRNFVFEHCCSPRAAG